MNNDLAIQEIIDKLDPDTKKRFEDGEIGIDDLKGLGLIPDDDEDDFLEDYGEEGEEEQSGSENQGLKKQKMDQEGENSD
jgi:hypothetical protein